MLLELLSLLGVPRRVFGLLLFSLLGSLELLLRWHGGKGLAAAAAAVAA